MVSRRFKPPGQRLDPAAGPLGQLHELEQLVGPLADELAGQVEVAPVDEEVVADRQLQVEAVLLRHDPEPAPDLGALGGGVAAQHPQGAGRRRRDAADHPHGAALAGSVGSEEAERLTPLDVEVDAVHGREVAEALRQAARVDEG